MVDALIISGGGKKGFAYIGALEYLFESEIINMNTLKAISCSSVGAFIALLLCLNFTPIEIHCFIASKKLPYANVELINIASSILQNGGCYDIKEIKTLISEFIRTKYDKVQFTMKELFELSNVDLFIVTSNLTDIKTEVFNYSTHPDDDVLDICILSASLPFVFKKAVYKDKLYSDGGISDNCPLEPVKKYDKIIAINSYEKKPIDNNTKLLDYMISVVFYPFLINQCLKYSHFNKNITYINIPLDSFFFSTNLSIKESNDFFYTGYEYAKLFMSMESMTFDLN